MWFSARPTGGHRGQVVGHRQYGPSAVAEQSDSGGVPAEQEDLPLNPLESQHRVVEAEVSRSLGVAQGQKS